MRVNVTVTAQGKVVDLDQLADARAKSAFQDMARQVGSSLDSVRCPVHDAPAKNVRLHFDARGVADLRYDSCCEKLGAAIQRVLG